MVQTSDAYRTRDFITRRLEEDLLGADFDAELTEAPLSRFIVGVLYPGEEEVPGSPVATVEENDVDASVDSTPDNGASDGVDDPGVSLARSRYPRTMGLTFAVREGTEVVDVGIEASRYEQVDDDEERWRRVNLEPTTVTLDCTRTNAERRDVAPGLQLVPIVRPPLKGVVSVTLALVNTAVVARGSKDSYCWFAPKISVRAAEGILTTRPDVVVPGLDDDEIHSQHLLFRDVRSYAVGHGCAVTWAGATDVSHLETTFIPRHELPLNKPGGVRGGGQEPNLGMDHLAASADLTDLRLLVDDYRAWIDTLPATTGELDLDAEKALDRHMNEARAAAARMQSGIELLERDEHVRHAFSLMNRAMAEQRSRQAWHREGHHGDPPSTAGASWRPFQIAFILTNLVGLAEPDSDDRELADLLWFPTGGGKTEAYLGLIGMAILLRRLRNPAHGGVSAIMRYTLRLLTLQQYERATGLICALENLRELEIPEAEPISIGLWVGQGSTPNKIVDAKRALNRMRGRRTAAGTDEDFSDPVQLRGCPWCGADLDHEDYVIVGESMEVRCPEATCRFRHGLPVHIVDDDVYANRPSLLIATVDKFAMMPWKAEVGLLFSTDGEHPAPDLIVQDELHLISGPLGTMVGLYETAVDAACSDPRRPKVVASTATIRRASDQMKAVFAREARQFPPQAASQADSYFAVEASRDEKGTREYTGVMAPGTSHATLMVRVYASLLQSAAQVPEDDPGADLYWSLLGYFNSLRVLGGAYIQVIDDVPDQIKVVAGRRGETPRPIGADALREMTSRKKSTEIPAELKILARKRGEQDAADVILATNMISVGVDVDRLGLMAVMGQPQTTSEYIQATSRVGRQDPGLVVVLYNANRSRDLSHYEDFTAYHRSLYRHVEATGATPFAPRARDRGLHGVLVSLARLTIPEASTERAAGHVHEWEDQLDAAVERIVARVDATRVGEQDPPQDESPDEVRDHLERLVDHWVDGDVDHYAGWFQRRQGALLEDAGEVLKRGADDAEASQFPPSEPPWPTLTSMRDVDAECGLRLIQKRRSRRAV